MTGRSMPRAAIWTRVATRETGPAAAFAGLEVADGLADGVSVVPGDSGGRLSDGSQVGSALGGSLKRGDAVGSGDGEASATAGTSADGAADASASLVTRGAPTTIAPATTATRSATASVKPVLERMRSMLAGRSLSPGRSRRPCGASPHSHSRQVCGAARY